jgi:hypothetical protein
LQAGYVGARLDHRPGELVAHHLARPDVCTGSIRGKVGAAHTNGGHPYDHIAGAWHWIVNLNGLQASR